MPVRLFKCLADETRLRCILLLRREGPLCVCDLTEALELAQPRISRHLAQLRHCALLSDQRQGQWVYYRINPELPPWFIDIIDAAAAALQNEAPYRRDCERLQRLRQSADPRRRCGV